MSTGSSSAHLALHQAADRDDVAALKDEILQGADVQAQSRGYQETPLHRASYAGAAGCVAELLRARADLNAKRAGGFTALHLAETVEVAKLLLDAGADRSIRANVRRGTAHAPTCSLSLRRKPNNPPLTRGSVVRLRRTARRRWSTSRAESVCRSSSPSTWARTVRPATQRSSQALRVTWTMKCCAAHE